MTYTQQGNVRGKIEGTETCLGKALFFKNTVFGDLHFLLMVPFLLIFSIMVIYVSSFFYAAPGKDKLTDTTFSFSDLKEEYVTLKTVVWYKNYQVWAGVLLVLSALIWIIFQ